MLTKNIYRFDDLVARELSKSEFDEMLRNRNDWYTTNRNEWYINTRICSTCKNQDVRKATVNLLHLIKEQLQTITANNGKKDPIKIPMD